ncbi:MAG: bacteriocin fulvocin C-related protein [Prevotellaceae bacterium]|jgi:hypothetical protein|nr:bacteriocin fulvocin C-related protein [Prevotellaceae bacterium]
MKKVFLFAAVVALGMSACQKAAEVYYSCDPTIDGIIKQRLPYYQGMTREEWKTLPDSLKNAAFVAMSPELKKKFWEGKYNEIMEYEHFTNTEKAHISKLYNYILSIDDIYADEYDSIKMKNVFDYYKEWAFYGVDSLNWDVLDVILIAEDKEELTGEYIAKFKQKANSPPDNSTLQHEGDGNGNEKPKCNCRYNLGCRGASYSYCDSKVDCKTKKDCGPLGVLDCDGRCNEPKTDKGSPTAVPKELMQQVSQREYLEYLFR